MEVGRKSASSAYSIGNDGRMTAPDS
jgi:hypothetical protein